MKTPTVPDHELSARQRRAVTDKPTSGSNEPRGPRRVKPVTPPQTPKLRRTATGQFAKAIKPR